MRRLWILFVLVAAAIDTAPVLGAVSPERMSARYGVALEDPNLEILMRHRAVLFGIVGGLLFACIFHPPLRLAAYATNFTSMAAFVVVTLLVGDYSAEIRSILLVDLVGLASLASACFIHFYWLREPLPSSSS